MLVDDKIYCGNKVIIHADADNTLRIEGMMCPDYYKIREVVYSKYFKI